MIVTAWDVLAILGLACVLAGLYFVAWPLVLVCLGLVGMYIGTRKA